METTKELGKAFGVPGAVGFAEGPGGLTVAELRHPAGCARVCTLGAHVLSYTPTGERDVLWVSAHSRFEVGTPIRGGVPVCWPVFADQTDSPTMPLHGFARRRLWAVTAADAGQDGVVSVTFATQDDNETHAIWPHAFRLELRVALAESLTVSLKAHNTDDHEAWSFTGALHSYFTVGDVTAARVRGLDGCVYQDKVDGFRQKSQRGPVRVQDEVDRIYLATGAETVIEDPVLKRRIRVLKEGSQTTVIWNPWSVKAAAMGDFGDEEYQGMICVETACAADDIVRLEPGQVHKLGARLSAESFDSVPT